MNQCNNKGSTALMFVSDSECLEELMEGGADVNIKNDYQHTPLVLAIKKGNVDIVKLMIDAGADVNAVCECHGNGALLLAVIGGHVHCLRELIAAGVDVNTKNKKGKTCLMFVRDSQCCEELILAGADMNIKDTEGGTSLFYALLNGNVDVVEVLIDAGADTNIQKKLEHKDEIILMTKALAGNAECLQKLIDSGALAAAIEHKHLDFAKGLGQVEADMNTKYIHQRGIKIDGTYNECFFSSTKEESNGYCSIDTSLVYAAGKGKLSRVKELIAAGDDVNVVCE